MNIRLHLPCGRFQISLAASAMLPIGLPFAAQDLSPAEINDPVEAASTIAAIVSAAAEKGRTGGAILHADRKEAPFHE